MPKKEIIVIYKTKEYKVNIDTSLDDLYYYFLEEITIQTGEPIVPMKYKLTSINNSVPYLLIDENNIKQFLKKNFQMMKF